MTIMKNILHKVSKNCIIFQLLPCFNWYIFCDYISSNLRLHSPDWLLYIVKALFQLARMIFVIFSIENVNVCGYVELIGRNEFAHDVWVLYYFTNLNFGLIKKPQKIPKLQVTESVPDNDMVGFNKCCKQREVIRNKFLIEYFAIFSLKL